MRQEHRRQPRRDDHGMHVDPDDGVHVLDGRQRHVPLPLALSARRAAPRPCRSARCGAGRTRRPV
ncbi:hypothetical protein EGY16_37010 [Burkholderia pseudomallei]|nr:hypothetical protein EGY16_37010 [Burkholderia pseudomallei]